MCSKSHTFTFVNKVKFLVKTVTILSVLHKGVSITDRGVNTIPLYDSSEELILRRRCCRIINIYVDVPEEIKLYGPFNIPKQGRRKYDPSKDKVNRSVRLRVMILSKQTDTRTCLKLRTINQKLFLPTAYIILAQPF